MSTALMDNYHGYSSEVYLSSLIWFNRCLIQMNHNIDFKTMESMETMGFLNFDF